MKKQGIFAIGLMSLFTIVFVSFSGQNSKYPTGAPAGNTGSPTDGQNCTHCHGGSATTVAGWITSDVPAAGYTPGTTYTITAASTGSGRKGFEVSPQSLTGTLLGTIAAGSGNQVVGTKYLTHSAAVGGSSATWTFSWTAPAAGTGSVTFYGAFAVTQSATKLSTLIIPEKTTTFISNISDETQFRIFPNPVKGEMTVSFSLQNFEAIDISVCDITGNKRNTLFNGMLPPGPIKKSFDLHNLLPSGIYFITLSNGSTINVSKKVVLSF